MQITTLFVNYLYNVDIFSANTLPYLHAGLQIREFLGHNLEMIVWCLQEIILWCLQKIIVRKRITRESCDVCKIRPCRARYQACRRLCLSSLRGCSHWTPEKERFQNNFSQNRHCTSSSLYWRLRMRITFMFGILLPLPPAAAASPSSQRTTWSAVSWLEVLRSGCSQCLTI